MISSLVLLLALGLFLALPFVLSIGAVVFLPVVTAIILTIVLSPLADRLAQAGLPNLLASLLSLIVFLAVLMLALTAVFRPAVGMFDEMPAMLDRIGEHFRHLQHNFAWVSSLNRQVLELTGREEGREVVLKTPTMLEQVAFATPTVVLEMLLTFLMAFFMIEAACACAAGCCSTASIRIQPQGGARDPRRAGPRRRLHPHGRPDQSRRRRDRHARGLGDGRGCAVHVGRAGHAAQLPALYRAADDGRAARAVRPRHSASPLLGILPALAYLGLHTIESNVVTPAILGARFTMSPVMILIALCYFSWIWGVTGALLSVPILLAVTALIDHLGRPNLIGFIFGEPLFDDQPAGPRRSTTT